MRKLLGTISLLLCGFLLIGCGSKQERPEESKEAKALLQGVWEDEETDEVLFKLQGDSV